MVCFLHINLLASAAPTMRQNEAIVSGSKFWGLPITVFLDCFLHKANQCHINQPQLPKPAYYLTEVKLCCHILYMEWGEDTIVFSASCQKLYFYSTVRLASNLFV